MNKQCFRVIFSKTLQRLVVTSELAKSEGKSTEASSSSQILQKICKMRPLVFSLFCALGFVSLTENALAETLIIQADKSAPKNQQPIVLSTANGLPQINIQTPNDKGLSHNKYSQFNVTEKGAVLNNSRTGASTQLAGQVQGNPYLARGEAKVILNEVNSNKPSVMKGYVEVAGGKADVIIANPNGLHCDSCGIINSDRATFTTGKPEIKNGQVDNFKVEAGKVKVSGKGLDNSRVDYTEIIARETEANAGIWSKKETTVITGKNTVKRSDSDKKLQIIHTKQPLAEEAKPQFAIDVGELGGMYSGKIHLIGTENGVGVRNAGHIGASAETLQIDSKGRIVNMGTLNAQKQVNVTAQKGIDNQGKIENKQGDIQLKSQTDIQNSGSMVARNGNIQKNANAQIQQSGEAVAKGNISYNAATIHATKDSLIAAGVEVKDTEQGETRTLDATSANGKTVQLSSSGKTSAQGKNIASGKVTVSAAEIDANLSQNNAHTIEYTAKSGDIQVNNARLTAEQIHLTTPSLLSTQGSHLTAEVIKTQQKNLAAQSAVWKQTKDSDFLLEADQINTENAVFSTEGDFFVNGHTLINNQALLTSGKRLELNLSNAIYSKEGKLVADENLLAKTKILDNQSGLIYAKGNITLAIQNSLNNKKTQDQYQGIIALDELSLNTDVFDNQHGNFISAGKQTLHINELQNQKGVISSQSTQNIQATKNIQNQAGRVTANGSTIHAKNLDNSQQGEISSLNYLTLILSEQLNNQLGVIKSDKAFIHKSDSLNNHQGKIVSINDLVKIDIQKPLNNQQGLISADTVLRVNSDGLNNQAGNIQTKNGDLHLSLQKGDLSNRGGILNSGSHLSIISGAITNQQGTIFSNKNNNINTQQAIFDNTLGGVLQSLGDLSLHTSHLDNQGGVIQSQSNIKLISPVLLNNQVTDQDSLIEAGKKLEITASRLENRDTIANQENPSRGIIAKQFMLNSAKNLDNQKGGIYIEQQGDLNISDTLNNVDGEILSWGNLSFLGKKSLAVVNKEGKLQANRGLLLNAKSLSGDGYLQANDMTLKLQDSFDIQQDINVGSTLIIETEGDILNRKKLAAHDRLQLKADNITNEGEAKISSAETSLYAKSTVHNKGLLNSRAENGESKTVIKAEEIENIGTGRIYGDYVTLGAEKILNRDENGKSATIAARKHLNLAAREIQNETETYDPVKKGGSFIYSEGSINIGGKLDDRDTVIGNAEHLKNLSSIIEARGDIYLNINKINNKNVHYRSELETIHSEKVKEHFILPRHRSEKGGENVFNNGHIETIDTKNLTKGYYRKTWSYWQKYNSDTLPVITDINQITDKTMLAKPYALKCEDQNSVDCTVLPAGVYKKDSPVWTKFGIPAPAVDQPEMTPEIVRAMNEEDLATQHLSEEELDKLIKAQQSGIAPVVPEKPIKPTQNSTESAQEYQKRLAEYQTKLKAYEEAEAAYKRYVLLKPFIDWEADYGANVQDLSIAIEEHNKKVAGQEYAHFWNLWINERVVKENVTKASLPAQILAGGDINYKSDAFTNDKSWVIAGRALNQLGTGNIANLDDEEAVHQDWELGTREFSYTRWRGGTKRRHSRYDESGGALARLKEVHKDMNIFVELANTSPTTYKDYVNTKSINQVKEENNNVKITQRDNLNYSTINGLDTVDTVKELQTQKVPSIDTNNAFEIHSVTVDTRLPNQSIYRINLNADSHILIETDPDFTDKKRWLSSDYMFNALRHDHTNVHKRLGDGYYEQRLVREQINQLTGRYYLDNYSDFDEQYRALMDAGVTFAQKFNLRPGISLTPNQVAQLTSDIVWFESQQITLPNGERVSVLVPKVYALARKGDINGKGSLISADTLKLNSTEIINEGTMAGRKLVQFNAERMRNSGKLTGGVVSGKVESNLENIGGVIEADRAILLDIGGNFNHASTTQTTNIDLDGFKRTETNLDRKGLLHVKGKDGRLQINANNIDISGADVINDGQGSTYLSAKNQLNLTALQVGFDEKMGGGNHYRNEAVNDVVISNIQGNGNVTLSAKNIYSEGADLAAKEKLIVLAENDIVLGSATRSSDYEEYHRIKSSGAFGSSKKTSLDTDQQTLQVGTKLGGGEIILSAGHDVEAHNLQAIADNDLIIQGGNNVTIGSDVNRFKATHFEEKSKSGVFSGGGIGITFGKKSEKHEQETEGWQGSEARSTLGSLNGNITVSAGNHAHLAGVDAIASKELGKQILVEGESTYIGASEDTLSSREHHEQKQSGLTIAFSSAVTDGVMVAKQALNRSSEVKDERLGALLKVKATNEAYETVKKAQSLIETIQNASNVTEAAGNSDFKISVSVGASKNVSTSHTQQTTHKGSELDAGKVIVRATEGDNTIAGSKINATHTELEGNNVNLLGTTNSQTNRSDNKSSSWSVGVFVGKSGGSTGFGVEGAVNVGKGHSNSDSTVQNQTEINSDSLKIKAKETTTLKGAVANINHLALDTKNLHIESVQDTEKYDSKQTQGGVSGSVAIYGSGSSVSAQVSQQKANVDYAQVTQQSGFNIQESSQINVEENTHLKAGMINAQGDKANHQMTTGTLTTEAIENRSDIEVSSVSAGASTDMGQMATMAVGAALSALGNMSESERSQTKVAISSNINLSITDSDKQKALTGKTAEETIASLNRDTANANQAVEKADLSAIQEKQETAQVIGELSVSWTNRLVQPHLDEANKKRQEAEKLEKSDPLKSAQLKAEAKAIEAEYGLGSNLQMGIRAATAALQGLATGNANQAAVGLLSPYANKLIKEQTTNADGTVNTEANLMAHAVLGAVEAQLTGNNAVAGALGAFTAEAATPYLMQALYNTDKAENLTDSQKQNIANLSQIAAGLASGVTGDSTASFISGAEIGKRAVENNYLTSNEALKFEKELVECRKNNQDCSRIVQKYLDISNKRSQELRRKCSDGGARCAGMEEIIDAHTNVARVKNDTTGRIYLSKPLQDDETIKIVSYLNNNDLSYLNNNISTIDRVIYYGTDPTNWPFLLMGGKGLLAKNSKSSLLSTTAAMGINAGGQYALTGDVKISDLIMTGVVAKSTVNKGLAQTVNTNTLGSYYSSQINNNDNPALSALYSGGASAVGYKVTDRVVNKLNPIINPNYKKYEWKDTGYLGISYQPRLSNAPQVSGSIVGSLSYETLNNYLPKVELKGEDNESKK